MDIKATSKKKFKPYEAKVKKKFTTYTLMLFFAIASISILFLALTMTYLFGKSHAIETVRLQIPPIFYIDTIILAIGSGALLMANKAFKEDEANTYKTWLYVALLSGFSFLIGQIIGWVVLAATGFSLSVAQSSDYLYVISGIHAMHIIGGLAFLGFIFFQASDRLKDPALSVVYFSDPVPKEQLKLANYYWHFLGGVWLYLLLFFSIVR